MKSQLELKFLFTELCTFDQSDLEVTVHSLHKIKTQSPSILFGGHIDSWTKPYLTI